jgi:hypothetical protein
MLDMALQKLPNNHLVMQKLREFTVFSTVGRPVIPDDPSPNLNSEVRVLRKNF